MSLYWPSTLHSPDCPLNPGARNSLPQLWSPRHPSFPLKSFSATEEFLQLISRLNKMWYSRKKHETWCQKKSWDHSPTTYCLCDLESSFHPFLNLQSNNLCNRVVEMKNKEKSSFCPYFSVTSSYNVFCLTEQHYYHSPSCSSQKSGRSSLRYLQIYFLLFQSQKNFHSGLLFSISPPFLWPRQSSSTWNATAVF